MRRYRAWRNRLVSEAGLINGFPFRVTRRRGKVVGIELWERDEFGVYSYMALIDPSARNKDGL